MPVVSRTKPIFCKLSIALLTVGAVKLNSSTAAATDTTGFLCRSEWTRKAFPAGLSGAV